MAAEKDVKPVNNWHRDGWTGPVHDEREAIGYSFPPEIGLRPFAFFGKGDGIGRMKRKK